MIRLDRCTRDSLIDWLLVEVPRRHLRRAIEEERVEVLGLFRQVRGFPAVLVRVTTKHGTDVILALAQVRPHKINMMIVEDVQWENYIGMEHGTPVLAGDFPDQYVAMREEHQRC